MIPNNLDFNHLVSRLESSKLVTIVDRKERSRYFTPPSEEYTKTSVPSEVYQGELFVAPSTPTFTQEEIDNLNAYLVKLVGEPEPNNGRKLSLIPFEELDDFYLEAVVAGNMESFAAMQDARGRLRSELTGQLVVRTGYMFYQRSIGTESTAKSFKLDFHGLGVEGPLTKGNETFETPIVGLMKLSVYPSIDHAREASQNTKAYLRSHIIRLPGA